MSFEQELCLDCTASRQELRDLLVSAGIGLEVEPDFRDISCAVSLTTHVMAKDQLEEAVRSQNNGVRVRCAISFYDRKAWMSDPNRENKYEVDTLRGVMTLLHAFPEAVAYWIAYDAEAPVLLRRHGRLILAEKWWIGDKNLPLVDLPYVIEPLGPWEMPD